MLDSGRAAIWSHGTLVGDGLIEIDAGVPETINAGEHLRPNGAAQRFVARIGAAIIDVLRCDSGDDAVFVESDPRFAEGGFVSVGAGNVVLGTRFNPFEGAP